MAYTLIKPEFLMKDKEYVQDDSNKDKGKVLEGIQFFRGKTDDGYLFEDSDGNVNVLTEDDLNKNLMIANTITGRRASDYAKEKERMELAGDHKHDPYELIRMAHAFKYHIKPQDASIKYIEKEETNDILAYMADIKKQDYLLLVKKKSDDTLDYETYDYGMFFKNGIAPMAIKVGKTYFVDNKRCQCVQKTANAVVFCNITVSKRKGQKQEEVLGARFYVPNEHITVFNNVQKDPRKVGELETKDVTMVSQLKPEDVLPLLDGVRHDNDLKEEEIKDVPPTIYSKYVRAIDKTNKEAFGADSAYAQINGSYNPNRVTYQALKKDYREKKPLKYLTPFGEQSFKTSYVPSKLKEEKKMSAIDVYNKVMQTYDYNTADYFHRHNTNLYLFGKMFFTTEDMSNGIILRPLVVGKTYETPDGPAVYQGQTMTGAELVDFVRDYVEKFLDQRKFSYVGALQRLSLTEKFPLPDGVESGLRAFSKPFQEAVYELVQLPVYNFGEHKYSFYDIQQGLVKEADKLADYKDITDKREEVRLTSRVTRQMRQPEEEHQEVQKVMRTTTHGLENARHTGRHQLFMTEVGPVYYINKYKDKQDKKTRYAFMKKSEYERITDAEFEKLTPDTYGYYQIITYDVNQLKAGNVINPFTNSKDYIIDGRRTKYIGYNLLQDGRAYYIFQDIANGQYINCSFKKILKGKVLIAEN